MKKPYFLIAIPYYFGRLFRFVVYISVWALFSYALYRHFRMIETVFNAEYFLYLTLKVLIDMAVLTISAVMFYVTNPTLKNYTMWTFAGLLLIIILLFIPPYRII